MKLAITLIFLFAVLVFMNQVFRYNKTNSMVKINPKTISVTPTLPWKQDSHPKLMPMGDSITAYYQAVLFKQIGWKFQFVGSMHDNHPAEGDYHEGQYGWEINNFIEDGSGFLLKYRPDVVLLMIGTNDIVRNEGADTAPQRLNTLLNVIQGTLPNVRLYVASIPPMVVPKDPIESGIRTSQYNKSVEELIQKRKDLGENIEFVDIYNSMFITDLSEDGVHPLGEGLDKISSAWVKALEPLLN